MRDALNKIYGIIWEFFPNGAPLFGNPLFKALLDGEQAWTSILNLKSFVMDSVQVGKAVFGKESYTTLGIEPRTYSNPGRYGNPTSVGLKITCGHSPLNKNPPNNADAGAVNVK